MLLVAADLHLDAAASLSRLPDQESSWKRFCTAAAELGATVLWAGDSHHFRKPSPAAIAAWQSGLEILREGGCALYGIPGNHCITSEDQPSTLEVACAGYDCTIFRAPDSRRLEDGIVAFLPWAPPRLPAREASEALMVLAAEQAERGARILIAHHAIAGGSLPQGLPVLDLAEPMLDPHALAAMGYEVVIAGHIHRRQVILQGDSYSCLIAQCGPLAIGNFGERDCETGGWQIDRCPLNGSEFLRATPFDIPDRRWLSVEVDARGLISPVGGILEILCEHEIEDAIVRVTYQVTAEQVVNTAAIVAYLEAEGAHRIDALTPIIERAASVRSQGVTEATPPTESMDAWIDGQEIPDGIAEAVRETAHERIGSMA